MANKEFDVEKLSRLIGINGFDIEYSPIIDSTSSAARRHVLAGGKTPRVFIASEQLEGRGRMGRSFYSPANTGVYFSILFADKGERDTVLMTTAAAVAIRRAILNGTGVSTEIKWVNDLYYQNKKVCGILAESVFFCDVRYIILGIGINLCTEEFPEDLAHKAGSLGVESDLSEVLISECIKQLGIMWQDLDGGGFMDEYRENSMVLGKNVIYTVNGIEREGIAKGIDERGRLAVKHEDGSINVLSSGEISLRLN